MTTAQKGRRRRGDDAARAADRALRGLSLPRSLAWYFGGLIAVYAAGLALFWPASGTQPREVIFLVVMLAPTVGALLARIFGEARIQLGRPGGRWLLAGLLPVLAVLVVDLASVAVGWTTFQPAVLGRALVSAPLTIGIACISALGEEIGWRGFLWPTLRARAGFWWVSLWVGLIWWAYHLPLILLGWYGSVSGLAAFTVAIAGFTLFVGVLTDRARAVWPSTLAHGAWNALVATSFAASGGSGQAPAFAGSADLGEFGWLAAAAMAVLGVLLAWWHVTTPLPGPRVAPLAAA